jgi:6-pyruvoyl-tetrahydropterin synthase
VHGHSYVVEIEVRGPVTALGWICDFDKLDAAWAPLHTRLDHRDLNDVLRNPTSENLVAWIASVFDQELFVVVKGAEIEVVRVRLSETPRSWAEWTPDPV